jgi:hypothetical protein
MAPVITATIVVVFLVNLSYPEWSGGWSTGPRLLVPLLPFAMLAVAGLIASGSAVPFSSSTTNPSPLVGEGRVVGSSLRPRLAPPPYPPPQGGRERLATSAAVILAFVGFVVISLFQGVGARVPDPVRDPRPGYHDPLTHPLTDAVWPIWRGDASPEWVFGQRFSWTILDLSSGTTESDQSNLARSWRKFLPLWIGQALAIALLFLIVRPTQIKQPDPGPPPVEAPPPARPDPA